MNRLLRTCGWGALLISAVCVASQAEAGGRRWCNYQSNSYYPAYYSDVATAPVAVGSTVTTDGRQRYQSGYQAPATAAPVYVAPARAYHSGTFYSDRYYYDGAYYRQPLNGFDPSAARKSLDGRMQH